MTVHQLPGSAADGQALSLDKSRLIDVIKNDPTINTSIAEAAFETPEQAWTVIDIHECVYDALDIDIETSDTEIFGHLLTYFNHTQIKIVNAEI